MKCNLDSHCVNSRRHRDRVVRRGVGMMIGENHTCLNSVSTCHVAFRTMGLTSCSFIPFVCLQSRISTPPVCTLCIEHTDPVSIRISKSISHIDIDRFLCKIQRLVAPISRTSSLPFAVSIQAVIQLCIHAQPRTLNPNLTLVSHAFNSHRLRPG